MFKFRIRRNIVQICLFWFLIQFVMFNIVQGQTTPYATYGCTVKADSEGNGNVSAVYMLFAGDQYLHVPSSAILFPVYNSTAILESTIDIRDSFGNKLTWSWETPRDSLRVFIGPLDISAGGKYEVRIIYSQQYLATIVNATHYFVYEWDFSKIMYNPYTVTQYILEFERPSDTLFDTYSIDYIGVSPVNLNDYVAQRGSFVSLSYNFSVSKVTINVYYRQQSGFPIFTFLTAIMFGLILTMAISILRRRRRGI